MDGCRVPSSIVVNTTALMTGLLVGFVCPDILTVARMLAGLL